MVDRIEYASIERFLAYVLIIEWLSIAYVGTGSWIESSQYLNPLISLFNIVKQMAQQKFLFGESEEIHLLFIAVFLY